MKNYGIQVQVHAHAGTAQAALRTKSGTACLRGERGRASVKLSVQD